MLLTHSPRVTPLRTSKHRVRWTKAFSSMFLRRRQLGPVHSVESVKQALRLGTLADGSKVLIEKGTRRYFYFKRNKPPTATSGVCMQALGHPVP